MTYLNIAILTNKYPSENDYYANMFVHKRAIEYKKWDNNVAVFIIGEKDRWTYEGINVISDSKRNIEIAMEKFRTEKCVIHFIKKQHMDIVLKYHYPTVVFFHGYEILSWKRRKWLLKSYKAPAIIFTNIRRRKAIKRFVKKTQNKNVAFVFVSNFLYKTGIRDIGTVPKRNYIIPNPIDTEKFAFREKTVDFRTKILLINSFANRTYANDIAQEAILMLSEKEWFYDLSFTIVGFGKLFEKDTAKIKNLSNVNLVNTFFDHNGIKSLFNKNGVFLCPKRQDTQGVTMCEAMSAGLCVMPLNNSAISEFVPIDRGVISTNALDLSKNIEWVYNNPHTFLTIAKNGSKFIQEKCNKDYIIRKELEIIYKI